MLNSPDVLSGLPRLASVQITFAFSLLVLGILSCSTKEIWHVYILGYVLFFFSLHPDINECASGAHSCSLFANCTNSNGSFSCSCLSGYMGNGMTCDGELSMLFT